MQEEQPAQWSLNDSDIVLTQHFNPDFGQEQDYSSSSTDPKTNTRKQDTEGPAEEIPNDQTEAEPAGDSNSVDKEDKTGIEKPPEEMM
ncbi:MAG: hypothetical protein SH856_05545 [Flavobacteriales bacterium]|nr:hypothetical protein [Flavobacteriales bacterium]